MSAHGSNHRVVSIVCRAGLGVGVLLVVAGALWQALAKPEDIWSESKAEEFLQARTRWHDLEYSDPHQPSANESAERAAQRQAAQKRFEKIQAELNDAISTHRHRGT